jgi:phage host-nuclease inhibitor protein Gam
VALAAIQGLDAKLDEAVTEKATEIAELRAEVAVLRAQLAACCDADRDVPAPDLAEVPGSLTLG